MRELLDSLQSNVRPVLDICADTLAYLKALCRNTLLMKGFIIEERQIGINIQHNHQNLQRRKRHQEIIGNQRNHQLTVWLQYRFPYFHDRVIWWPAIAALISLYGMMRFQLPWVAVMRTEKTMSLGNDNLYWDLPEVYFPEDLHSW